MFKLKWLVLWRRRHSYRCADEKEIGYANQQTHRPGLALVFVSTLFLGEATYAEKPFIVVQSTTSTQDTGPAAKFTDQTGIVVRVVAVGNGQALKNAQNGDGDVVFVDSRAD